VVAQLATKLKQELINLWATFDDTRSDGRKIRLMTDLETLGKSALSPKSPPGNVDHNREKAWEVAALTCERMTGRKPSVSVAGPESKSPRPGKAFGPFVRFVEAFMAAIPDEPRPTGDQIKHFVKRRRMASSRQPLKGSSPF
jgi:hypothetical protein